MVYFFELLDKINFDSFQSEILELTLNLLGYIDFIKYLQNEHLNSYTLLCLNLCCSQLNHHTSKLVLFPHCQVLCLEFYCSQIDVGLIAVNLLIEKIAFSLL